MTAKWGSGVFLILFLAVLAGCRTPQPEMIPGKSTEHLVEPPQGRYEQPGFPPEALDRTGERPIGNAPRSVFPVSGIGSQSNGGMGPYKF